MFRNQSALRLDWKAFLAPDDAHDCRDRWLACAALAVGGGAYAQHPRRPRTSTLHGADNRAHYTNIKKETDGKQCTVVTREVSVVPAPAAAAAAARGRGDAHAVELPAGRPGHAEVAGRRPPQNPRGRAHRARRRASAEARRPSSPSRKSVRNGDEKNYQRVLDRLKPYQEAVERHERNVAALRRELAACAADRAAVGGAARRGAT